MLLEIFIYLIVGLLSGMLAGLLGIGGGIIIVPCLYFIYTFLETSISNSMHLAVGTSLAIITINSFFAMCLYEKRQAVFWSILKKMNIFLVLGSILGVIIAYFLPNRLLTKVFAVFAFLLGIYFVFFKKKHHKVAHPKIIMLIFSGITIGLLATLLGIGGGVIAIPFFIFFLSVPNYCLIGTASASTFITSFVGCLVYLIMGLKQKSNLHSIGYIHIPAFLFITVFSLFFVYIGIKLSDRLHIKILKRIFGASLAVTGILMFIK